MARWISHAPAFGKASKASGGSVEAPCWTAPPDRIRPRDTRQLFKRDQIQLDVGADLAVGRDEPAVRRTGLHADLADADQVRALGRKCLDVAAHEGVQLVHVGVVPADLPDLAPHRHRDALGLVLADVLGELRTQVAVHRLLLVERGLVEVHQGGSVDVDVVEARRDLLADECAERLELLGAIWRCVLLQVHLDVVALEEHRADVTLAQGGRKHHGRVLVRALLGVAHLGPRDLEDKGAGPGLVGRPERRARRVVGRHPDVHRRHGEPAGLSASHREIQVVDRRWPDALGRGKRPYDPAGRALDLRRRAKSRRVRKAVNHVRACLSGDLDGIAVDLGDRGNSGDELFNRGK